MPSYEVMYAFEVVEGREDPEGNKYARGSMKITTDEPIETQEQVREVTKQIYRELDDGSNFIKQLAVENIYNLNDDGEKIELAD